MTDLLIILLFIVIGLCFVLRKPKFPTPQEILKEALDKRGYTETEKPIIEDSSHLKAELVKSNQLYTAALHQIGQLQFEFKQVSSQLNTITAAKDTAEEALAKVTSQKKSGEVRLGQISEQLLPLLPDFPVPVNTLKFFGQPLDYISIDLDSEWISFIELKSGGAVLSEKQRKIRKMIEDKKVRFFEVRIDEKGMKVK